MTSHTIPSGGYSSVRLNLAPPPNSEAFLRPFVLALGPMSVVLFIVGLAVALLVHFPVDWFVRWLRRKSDVPPRELRHQAVPVSIVGTFERLLAFFLVYLNVEGAYAILIAWMVAKLAANWQRQLISGSQDAEEADREIAPQLTLRLWLARSRLFLEPLGARLHAGRSSLLAAHWSKLAPVMSSQTFWAVRISPIPSLRIFFA